MIIDLSKPRKEYFKRWSSREILLQYFKEKPNFTVNDLRKLNSSGKVITGTKEGNLEALLELDYELDTFSLVEKNKFLRENELLVLPPDYRITAGDSRQVVVYSEDSLIDLDSAEVRKAILRDEDPGRILTQSQKERYHWSPEKVIRAAFNNLHKHKEENMDKVYIGYCWTGMDRSLRVVPIMNAIKGAELRAFQNLAYYKVKWPQDRERIKKELARGINLETGKALTSTEKEERETKLRRYNSHLQSARREGHTLKYFVDRLQLRKRDLIEPGKRPFDWGRGRNFKVPSRGDIYREHRVKAMNIPLFFGSDPRRFSLVWEIMAECTCADSDYRSDRRRLKDGPRRKEYVFCGHEIPSLVGLQVINSQRKYKKRIHSLPFIMPAKELMDYVDVLRYQTVLLDYNQKTKRFSIRALNDTEIGNLVLKKFTADSYGVNGTTEISKLTKGGYDPHQELIKFRKKGVKAST